MSDQLPAPLVPLEADLRNYSFTPMYRARLFGSSFHARVSDGGWRAGVTLWLKSWDQVPAGSLPDDEIDLCRLAELGRDVKSWRKIKEEALHGWFKCSDGRLYHKVVAEGVNEAWQGKLEQRDRTAKARATKLNKQQSQGGSNANAPPVTDGASSVTETVTGSNRKGEGKGKGEGLARFAREERAREVSSGPIAPSVDAQPDGEMPEFLRRFPDPDFQKLANAYPNVPNSSLSKAWEIWQMQKGPRISIAELLQCVDRFKALIADENRKRPASDPYRVCSLATWLEEERWASFLSAPKERAGNGISAADEKWREIWSGHALVPRLVEAFGAGEVVAWFSGSRLVETPSEVTIVTSRRLHRDEITTRYVPQLERLFGGKAVSVRLEEELAAA